MNNYRRKPIRWPGELLRRDLLARPEPLPPPPSDIFDEPFVCLPINLQWLPHVFGVVDTLREEDSWTTDIYRAQQNIERFIGAASSRRNPCAPVRQMAPILPDYPPGVDFAGECLVVDTRVFQPDVYLITDEHIQQPKLCDDYTVQVDGQQITGEQSDMSAAAYERIEQLQQDLAEVLASDEAQATQLQALQSQIDALASQNTSLQSQIDANERDIDQAEEDLLLSVRWYPQNAPLSSGWYAMNGRNIGKDTASDALWSRIPDAWKTTPTDATLPTSLTFEPATLNSGARGASGSYTVDGGTGGTSVNFVVGQWYIYLGES